MFSVLAKVLVYGLFFKDQISQVLRNIGPLGCDFTDWFVSDMVLNPEFSCISSLLENTLYAWCFNSYKPGVPFMGAFMRRPVWGYCLLREFIEKLNEM